MSSGLRAFFRGARAGWILTLAFLHLLLRALRLRAEVKDFKNWQTKGQGIMKAVEKARIFVVTVARDSFDVDARPTNVATMFLF